MGVTCSRLGGDVKFVSETLKREKRPFRRSTGWMG
jgi:hypothetical protein